MANLKARKAIEEAKLKLCLKEEELIFRIRWPSLKLRLRFSRLESEMSEISYFIPIAKSHRIKERVSVPEVKTTSGDRNTQSRNATDYLIKHLSLNRLPVPGLGLFYGHLTQYPSWKLGFETLISQKGMSECENVYYRKHYLRGDATSCVEGFFLLNSSEVF